ncbi:hypothetical protein KJ567_05120, partial [Candidatus Bipolaricaulota bacterium]|nr:hypothetical protein [Candidatus Bipolaricaulota bacterium]
PEMAINILYKAFDDIISGSVNTLDTLGRFLNLVHEVGIEERQASLVALRSRIEDTCPLSIAIDNSLDYHQLKLLRRVRGELQHSAFEHVLRRPETNVTDVSAEPMLADRFELESWSNDRAITRLADRVVASLGTLLQEATAVLASNPAGAIQKK